MWLDSSDQPYAFNQFWLNADDRDVVKYLRCSRSPPTRSSHRSQFLLPLHRVAQALARCHHLGPGRQAYEQAIAAASALFGGGELTGLDSSTLGAATSELPRGEVSTAQLAEGLPVADAFVASGIVKSKGEARRAIKDGGAYVNNVKVADQEQTLTSDDVLSTEAGGVVLLRQARRPSVLSTSSADHRH